jgi:hypothetical protein
MTVRLNREAYEKAIAEDIAWLNAQPRTLERDHVVAIVQASPNLVCGDPEADRYTESLRQECERLRRERDADTMAHALAHDAERRGLLQKAETRIAELEALLATCLRPLPLDMLPPGTSGVTPYLMIANGEDTLLLILAPGGVLGEQAHEQVELGMVLRGGLEDAWILAHPRHWAIPAKEAHRLVAGPHGALVACWFDGGRP